MINIQHRIVTNPSCTKKASGQHSNETTQNAHFRLSLTNTQFEPRFVKLIKNKVTNTQHSK